MFPLLTCKLLLLLKVRNLIGFKNYKRQKQMTMKINRRVKYGVGVLTMSLLVLFISGCGTNESNSTNADVVTSEGSEIMNEETGETVSDGAETQGTTQEGDSNDNSNSSDVADAEEMKTESGDVVSEITTESKVEEKPSTTEGGNEASSTAETDDSETTESKPAEPAKPSIHSHQALNELLKKYVSASGKVNYKGMKTEQAKLKAYITLLSQNAPGTWSRNEKLAYWINLYNASTLSLILDNYPLASITDLTKPWDQTFITSGTQKLSLNDIENKIIRPQFKEPRIHFAVNCAAKSCPKLLNEAFLAGTLESQFKKSAVYFVNNSAKNTIGATSIKVSKIFEWYAEDFGGKEGLIGFLNTYSNTDIDATASIGYAEYDWKLNE